MALKYRNLLKAFFFSNGIINGLAIFAKNRIRS